ncbi:TnpV protein [[Ruminococcus] lactaris]|uniref:TnpV protein n=1 Tax=[Ruminococcus] lactaris TaxID=46228 RepID=UPI00242FCEB3|nr:TnpV protein [[Ruminococcus] lactaris]
MMMARLGINVGEYFEAEDFRDVTNFNTQETLNALGFATSDITEMGLSEISKPFGHSAGIIASLKRTDNLDTIGMKIQPKGAVRMNEITYTMVRDYNLPDLILPEQPEPVVGKWSQMRRTFLKEQHRSPVLQSPDEES